MSIQNAKKESFMDNLRSRLEGVNLRQNGIFLALIGLIIFFAATTPGAASITPDNVSNLVMQNGYILVLAIGMVMVIIAGHIDLSVGSIAAFIGAVAGVFVVRPLEQDGWEWLPAMPWFIGIIAAILVGALVGVWQGFWVAYVGIPAFIVTLAGMLIFRGLALMTLQNSNIGPFPDEFRAIGNGFFDKENTLGASLGFPVDLNAAALVLTVVGILALWWREVTTRRGRAKYGQAIEPWVWFLVKNTMLTLMIGGVGYQLARANGIPYLLILMIFLIVIYSLIMNKTTFGRHIYAIG
jgi:putative multiple sugar transport system permease protein